MPGDFCTVQRIPIIRFFHFPSRNHVRNAVNKLWHFISYIVSGNYHLPKIQAQQFITIASRLCKIYLQFPLQNYKIFPLA